MVLKRILARNIIFNWSSQACEIALGLFVAPFLVNRMGDTTYGLWTVIGALTGYFGFIDFGTRTSVGRFMAFHRAKKDFEGVNTTFNSAGFLLAGVGLFSFLVMLCLQLVFFHIFQVPEEQVNDARLSLFLVSISLGLTFPLTLFDATLWGLQRFDWLNSIDILVAGSRAVLTFSFIRGESDIVTLAWITLSATLLSGLAKGYLSLREEPRLRFRLNHITPREFANLFGYGIWRTMMSAGEICTARINPILIGSCLSIAMVTPFSFANRLVTYVNQVFLAIRAVLTPAAAALHGEGTRDWQRKLMIEGGKYSSLLALFIITSLICLGNSFFTLWLGPRLAYASQFLTILALGSFLPLSQSATFSMLLGIARHQILGWLSLLEIVATVIVAIIMIGPMGLIGACLAQALTGTICRGVIPLFYGCRSINLPIRSYVAPVFLLPFCIAVLPFICLYTFVDFRAPKNWGELFAYAFVFTLCYAVLTFSTLGLEKRKSLSTKRIKALVKVS